MAHFNTECVLRDIFYKKKLFRTSVLMGDSLGAFTAINMIMFNDF